MKVLETVTSQKSLGMVTSMRGSGYFDWQGHNSLNFGPIFKILVAKHISVPRPFIWCAEHPRGTWLYAPKRVLKLVHENQKSQKLKKINFPSEGQPTFCRNLNLHGQSDLLGQKKEIFSCCSNGVTSPWSFDLYWPLTNYEVTSRGSRVWHFFRGQYPVILPYCKPKSGLNWPS